MNRNEELDALLAEIGREHRNAPAPERVEAVLCAAVDRRGRERAARKQAWAWAFAVVLLAALAVSGVVVEMRRSVDSQDHAGKTQQPVVQQQEKIAQPQVATSTQAVESAHTIAVHAQRTKGSNARAREAAPERAAGNSLQEFIPLPASEGLPPATQLSVVRVKLQGSDLQQYGLEAPANALARSLLAEFVVGQDGLPRAIRILQ
jgi:hypothetical protein